MLGMSKTNMALAVALMAAAAPVPAQDVPKEDPTAAWKALTAKYEAETQSHIASKAKSDAEAAAASAKLGPLASYTREGSVEVGANSGKLEATLLASEATRLSAARIVDTMCDRLKIGQAQSACGPEGAGSPLVVFTDTEKPQFDAYDAFTAQLRSIRAQLARVKDRKPVGLSPGRGPISGSTFGLAGISTLVSTAGNLLRSDYKLSSVDVSQDDTMLLKAFLEQARAKSLRSPIRVPTLFGGRIDFDTNPAIRLLELVETERNVVAEQADALRRQAAAKPKNKAAIEEVVKDMSEAVSRFDAFALQLGTADDKGNVPLAVIARQASVVSSLTDDGYILMLKADMAGGSAYSQQNFFTFLGTMPFSVSGGSLVSYTLLKGRDGEFVDSAVLAQTQPFTKIHAATRRFLNGSK